MIPILLVADLLRLWNLGSIGFNSDEAVYAGQAAALAGNEQLANFFSIFRAHPLFFQFVVSIVYRFSFGDIQARVISVAFATATIYVTYLLGKLLYSRNTGLAAASFLALMPYGVVVSRQALLDIPLTFFSVLSVYFLALFFLGHEQHWFYLTGVSIGLATLTKEVGILLAPVALLSAALTRTLTLRKLGFSSALFATAVLPYPLSIVLNRGVSAPSSYFIWQLSRPPNHVPSYFLDILVQYAGYPFLAVAAIGVSFLVIRRKALDTMLLLWLVVPLVFFQLWPTKLFPYIYPVIPALSVLAGYGLSRLWRSSSPLRVAGLALVLLALSTFMYSSASIAFYGANPLHNFAGEDVEVLSFAGAREAAFWIRDNTPENSIFMTIGPSMANIIEFYSGRRAFALSVSANPARRNPAYASILNPEIAVRAGIFDYIVFDRYSAQRTSFYAQKVLDYVLKYDCILVHETSVFLMDGSERSEGRIWIYQISH